MFSLFSLQYPVFTLPSWSESTYFFVAIPYHLLALLFVFSPFFIVIKKWRPVTWWKMAIAIVSTFLLHIFVMFGLSNYLARWLARYVENSQYFTGAIDAQFMFSFLVSLLLVFSPFLSVWLIYHKYTWSRFFTATVLAVVLMAIFLVFYYWLLMQGIRGIYEHLN